MVENLAKIKEKKKRERRDEKLKSVIPKGLLRGEIEGCRKKKS